MNTNQRAIIRVLREVQTIPYGYDARFIRSLDWMRRHEPEKTLTPKQRYQLQLLAYRYRRQLAGSLDESLIPTEAPDMDDYVHEKPQLQVDLLDGSARPVPVEEHLTVEEFERLRRQGKLL